MTNYLPARKLFAFGFLLLMLNDFAFMALSGRYGLLLADYAFKLVIVAAILWPTTDIPLPPVKRRSGVEPKLCLGLALVLLLPIDWLSDKIDALLPNWQLFVWPRLESGWRKIVDLSFGLALTAFTEEFLFRRLALSALPGSMATRVLASSLLFGLIHWGGGLGGIVATALAGIILAATYLRTGSLMIAVMTHFLIDVIMFL